MKTTKDFVKTVVKVWQEVIINSNPLATPQNKPMGFVLGGQPGAGKSNLLKKLDNEFKGNIIVINGDDFRKYHPQYEHFQERYQKDSPKHTAEFAAAMTEAILQKAVSENYNIVIEGTFRTSETPLKTLALFKEHGYQTGVLIQTCHPNLSWASCIERYEKMLDVNPKEARFTDKQHHDNVVSKLAENVHNVSTRRDLVDRLEIYMRTKNNAIILLYPSKDKNQSIQHIIHQAQGISLNMGQNKGL